MKLHIISWNIRHMRPEKFVLYIDLIRKQIEDGHVLFFYENKLSSPMGDLGMLIGDMLKADQDKRVKDGFPGSQRFDWKSLSCAVGTNENVWVVYSKRGEVGLYSQFRTDPVEQKKPEPLMKSTAGTLPALQFSPLLTAGMVQTRTARKESNLALANANTTTIKQGDVFKPQNLTFEIAVEEDTSLREALEKEGVNTLHTNLDKFVGLTYEEILAKFRVPALVRVRLKKPNNEERTIRIAAWHAPGPGTGMAPYLNDSFQKKLFGYVDLFIGDFNIAYSSLSERPFQHLLLLGHDRGTTVNKLKVKARQAGKQGLDLGFINHHTLHKYPDDKIREKDGKLLHHSTARRDFAEFDLPLVKKLKPNQALLRKGSIDMVDEEGREGEDTSHLDTALERARQEMAMKAQMQEKKEKSMADPQTVSERLLKKKREALEEKEKKYLSDLNLLPGSAMSPKFLGEALIRVLNIPVGTRFEDALDCTDHLPLLITLRKL